MESSSTPLTDAQLSAVLHERGQRVTPQRVVINRALHELNRHVTADEVLTSVAERLPNVSAPTVYSTLELFEDLGVVRRLGVSHGAVVYDPRSDPHDHMVCDRCGKIEDLDGGIRLSRAIERASDAGFTPRRAEVRINGLCADCARAAAR